MKQRIQYCFTCECYVIGYKKWKYHRYTRIHIQNYYNNKLNEVTANLMKLLIYKIKKESIHGEQEILKETDLLIENV